MSQVLQREETLDSCLLGAMETFRNGCNFRLLCKQDGSTHLTYGCYGVHVNLVQGKERLLMNWLNSNMGKEGAARLQVEPKTIMELLSRRPCAVCGGARHEAAIAKATGDATSSV